MSAQESIADWLADNKTDGPAEMIWIDLETTGLDPLEGKIIEVGAFATDVWGAVVPNGVFHRLVYSSQVHEGDLDDFIFNMHSKSGLLEEFQHFLQAPRDENNPLSLEPAVEQDLATWIESHSKINRLPLAGSSVHFDRAWLKTLMPRAEAELHYRNIDSTSFKLVEDMLDRRRADKTTVRGIFRPEEEKPHRSLLDLVDSIRLYRYFLHEYFARGSFVVGEKGPEL